MKKNLIILIIFLLLIILDRISKILFFEKHFGVINYMENSGGLWGLFPGNNSLLVILTLIVVLILSLFLWSRKEKSKIPIAIVLAGLISNLIDRISVGYVHDFIDFRFWPVFNFSDAYVMIGVIILIVNIIRED